jgi:Cu+-exporting ATPase
MTPTTPPAVFEGLRTELTIEGMTCANCVRHVEEALTGIPGVRAEVDLAAGTATVVHPASVSVPTLLDVIDDAGYDAAVREAGSR